MFRVPWFLKTTQPHCQDFRLEPLPIASITEPRAHECFQAIAGKLALTFLIEALEIRNDTLEWAADFARLASAPEREFDFGLAGAPQQGTLEIVWQFFVRRFQALLVMAGHAAQQTFVISHHPLSAPTPGEDGALLDRLLRVRDDQVLIEDHLLAEAMANGTRARWRIEREMFWRQRVVAFSGGRAEVAIGVEGLQPGLRVED